MPRNNVYPELLGKLEKRFSVLTEKSLLPPEQQLADELGVSKPTLRRALQVMVDAGNLRKINGVGIMLERAPKTISRELIFVCHDILFFAEALNCFGAYAAEANYLISVIPLAGDRQAQERIIASVAERNPAGIIIYADPEHNDLKGYEMLARIGISSVYLIRLPEGVEGNLLEFGNADGMTEIVETYYRKGCRKFALYGDKRVNPGAAIERTQGFLNGMRVCRLKPREEYMCLPDASQDVREKFFQTLADSRQRPDVICCLNDHCAGQLMNAMRTRELDLSVFHFSGFDHSPLSEFLPQPVLTVEPPMQELGQAAAEMLVRQAENPHFGFQHRKLRTKVLCSRT